MGRLLDEGAQVVIVAVSADIVMDGVVEVAPPVISSLGSLSRLGP
jgi:hypothetical protein